MTTQTTVAEASDIGQYQPDFPDLTTSQIGTSGFDSNQYVPREDDWFLRYINDDKYGCKDLDKYLDPKDSPFMPENVQVFTLPTRFVDLGVRPPNHDYSQVDNSSVPADSVRREQTAFIGQPEDNYPIIEYDGKMLRLSDFNDELGKIKAGELEMAPDNIADQIIESVCKQPEMIPIENPSQLMVDLTDKQIEELLTDQNYQNATQPMNPLAPSYASPKSPVSHTTEKLQQFRISSDQSTPAPIPAKQGRKRTLDSPSQNESQNKVFCTSYDDLKVKRKRDATDEVRGFMNKKNAHSWEGITKLGKEDAGKLVTLLLRQEYHSDKGKTSKGIYSAPPANWPVGTFFGDPNNKQKSDNKKPGKPLILDMCRYLYDQWKMQPPLQ